MPSSVIHNLMKRFREMCAHREQLQSKPLHITEIPAWIQKAKTSTERSEKREPEIPLCSNQSEAEILSRNHGHVILSCHPRMDSCLPDLVDRLSVRGVGHR